MGPLRNLYQILQQDLGNNPDGKAEFKEKSVQYLERLARQLELLQYEVHFEPGGLSAPGDATLRGMWGEERGVHVLITEVLGKPTFLYRTIKSLQDYGGGPNHYIWSPNMPVGEPVFDEQVICERILKLANHNRTKSHQ